MSGHPTAFSAGSLARGRSVLAAIEAEFGGRREPGQRVRETFLDTFDWLVHASGGTLSAVKERAGLLLYRRTADGLVRHRLLVTALPEFAADLPESPLRDELKRVADCRRLFPVLRLDVRRTVLWVEDDRRKTVAGVALEHGTATDVENASRPRRVPPVFEVQEIRGYPDFAARIARFIEEEQHLAPVVSERFTRALALTGRSPGNRIPKPRLDPEQTAAGALAMVLQSLLDTMQLNVDGVRRDLDPEFLHDFRVAVRRTRSALGQVKHVLPAPELERFVEEFAWLGRETNLLRDLDVYLLELPGHRAALAEAGRSGLDVLEASLKNRREEEQQRLATLLAAERYTTLAREWHSFLAATQANSPRTAEGKREDSNPAAEARNAWRPIREVAAKRIRRAHKRVIDQGRKIEDSSPVEDLHRLRISCKKLRYLLEFFASIFHGPAVTRLVKALKRLQDNLGTLNDLAVQQEKIGDLVRELGEVQPAAEHDTRGFETLIERLEQRREAQRASFARCFEKFDDPKVERRFERALESVEAGSG